MEPQTATLIPASLREGAEEDKIPQKYTNWPNETACVTISYDNRNLLSDNLHLVCTLILQITKMGCCGNGHVLFRSLGETRKTPSKCLLRHKYSTFFTAPPHPERTNLLTVGIFFLALKMGSRAVICIFIMYTTNLGKWVEKSMEIEKRWIQIA